MTGTTDFPLGSTPRHFRDLYWCWIVNEPALTYYNLPPLVGPPDPAPRCSQCEGALHRGLQVEHTFIGHVRKPAYRAVQGRPEWM